MGLVAFNFLWNADCYFSLVSSTPAFEHWIRRKFVQHKLPSRIEDIFVRNDVDETIRCLKRVDAQTFIDVMDEVR